MSERRRTYKCGHTAELCCSLLLLCTSRQILTRRYRMPVGEAALFAKRDNSVAEIVIKARRTLTKVLETVSPHQQRLIARTAGAFLSQHPKWSNLGSRFEVIAVTLDRLPKDVTDAWRPKAE